MGEKGLGAAMDLRAGIARVQAALDLANAGFYGHLVEKKSAIAGVMAQLDKTFPTNDCTMWIVSPKLVEVCRHRNIKIRTLAQLQGIIGEPGNFTVTLEKQPRYVDPSKCTGCGDCTKVCPVTMPDEFNLGLVDWQAVYHLYPQAIPATFTIEKYDRAPGVRACPANLSAQGYVQLSKAGKYPEALSLIMDRPPLPGTIGRVCSHQLLVSATWGFWTAYLNSSGKLTACHWRRINGLSLFRKKARISLRLLD
jgi:heterodisulfide reductase subunit A-like polyferredoxin